MKTTFCIYFIFNCLCWQTLSQTLLCEFDDDLLEIPSYININQSYYTCMLFTKISDYDENLSIGLHVNGKDNSDVKRVVNHKTTRPRVITSIFCDAFENLEVIEFNYARIKTIEDDSMRKCTKLTHFFISSNKIIQVPPNLFVHNTKLEFVWFDDSQLTTVPEELFTNQRELKSFTLEDNHISSIPKNFFKTLVNLVELDLEENSLEVINSTWFKNLQKLEYLSFNRNKLTAIPENIFSPLINLNTLNLCRNKINVLHSNSFHGLKSLKLLILCHNNIFDLPQNVFRPLIDLKRLNLDSNQLTTIHSDSFGIHNQLNSIHIKRNKIISIDEKIIDDNPMIYHFNITMNFCANFSTKIRLNIKPKLDTCFKMYQPRLLASSHSSIEPSCGTSINGQGNIIGGSKIIRSSFPWIAALINETEGKFFCGGTLITNRKVISAAHCIEPKDKKYKLLPKEVIVLLGVHNLSVTHENGKISAAVYNIHVHPGWNPNGKRYDADISVLVLDENITFSRYVQPICMIQSELNPAAKIVSGVVVGFGKSEDETKIHEETPKIINIPIHNNEECFLEFPDLARISSQRTFCGGSANGTGVCLGDSGSGLVVKYNEAYYLRGLVSSSIRTYKWGCDVNKYSVFTDLLKYINWIDTINLEEPYSYI